MPRPKPFRLRVWKPSERTISPVARGVSSAPSPARRRSRLTCFAMAPIFTTDGVVEAENAQGEYFGEERLDHAALAGGGCEAIFAAVNQFCGSHPMQDDCTVVELVYVASTA